MVKQYNLFASSAQIKTLTFAKNLQGSLQVSLRMTQNPQGSLRILNLQVLKNVTTNCQKILTQSLPPFSLIRDFEKQNTRGNVSKISINHDMLSTCRIEIYQSQPASMAQRRSEGHASGCDWWISIRSVDNTQD